MSLDYNGGIIGFVCGSNVEVGGKLWFMWKNEVNLVVENMSLYGFLISCDLCS